MIRDLEIFVDLMAGRQYNDVERDLVASGFTVAKTGKDRESGGRRVRFTKDHHESATVIDVIHEWNVDHYGIGKPGKVISGKMVDPGARHEYS